MSESAHRNNEVALVFKDKYTLKCFSGYSTGLAFYHMCLCININLTATLVNYSVILIRMAESAWEIRIIVLIKNLYYCLLSK